MLTRLLVRNFKRFEDAEIELGPLTVLCGPNNSGKTTALQAIALWQAGVRAWLAKRGAESKALKRPGVQINRRDLVSIPVPTTNLLWKRLRTHEGLREYGKTHTRNVRIDIIAEGISDGEPWKCGLEFDYSGEEAIYCRPLRLSEGRDPERMPVPPLAEKINIALLPAMSGLAAIEPKIEQGRIDVLIGEGQTAQILRNLCFRIWESDLKLWETLANKMHELFRVRLLPPQHIQARGEIIMSYQDENDIELDLSASGRGQQQILLLLAYVLANPKTTLLLDEPDAHLEILRQREVYFVLTELADTQGSQIIAASHSEVVLNEAAGRDVVIAFVGKPHRIDDRGSQLKKWLAEYPIDNLYQAEQQGWVLYLEGSTDLAILRAFAEKLNHPAQVALARPFVIYVANDPDKVQRHFYALREAKPDISGAAIFDRLERNLRSDIGPTASMWRKREIENYFTKPYVLLDWAKGGPEPDLFTAARVEAMKISIEAIQSAQLVLGRDIWSDDIKATDDVLDQIFRRFFENINQPMQFRKRDYHNLVNFMDSGDFVSEISEKLDIIYEAMNKSRPRRD